MESLKHKLNKSLLIKFEDIKSDIEKIFDNNGKGGLIVKNRKNPYTGQRALKELTKLIYQISHKIIDE